MLSVILIAAAMSVVFPEPAQRLLYTNGRPRDGPRKPDSAHGATLGRWLARCGIVAADNRWDALLLDIAADIDLFAACSRAGLGPASAAEVVSQATCEALRDRWREIASLLGIGADPRRAWQPVAQIPGLGELAAVVANSHVAGAKIAASASRISIRLRQHVEDQAVSAGERAGVFIAMPLTFCFLPAFFLLGLAPVVFGLAGEVFG